MIETIYKGIVGFFTSLLLIVNPTPKTNIISPQILQTYITTIPTLTVAVTLTPSIIPSSTSIPKSTPLPPVGIKKAIITIPPTQISEGKLKACFTMYGNTVEGNTMYMGNDVTFDASCSENASKYSWYVNNEPLAIPSGKDENTFSGLKMSEKPYHEKKWTYCIGCAYGSTWHIGENDKTFKVEVEDQNGHKDEFNKVIKFKWKN